MTRPSVASISWASASASTLSPALLTLYAVSPGGVVMPCFEPVNTTAQGWPAATIPGTKAWTPEQVVDFLLPAMARGEFYVLCPDGETTRAMDEKRILWAAEDIVRNRPALSRWHPEHAAAFAAYMAGG